jgi:hypothetical protein
LVGALLEELLVSLEAARSIIFSELMGFYQTFDLSDELRFLACWEGERGVLSDVLGVREVGGDDGAADGHGLDDGEAGGLCV